MAEMNHQTDTPSFISVPSHTRLFHRDGGTYYLRAKVPEKIRHIIGKTEIRKSLRTKDFKDARQKVKIESVRVDALFAAAEVKLNARVAPVHDLSDEEINSWVRKYFINLERESRRMIENDVESIADQWTRQQTAEQIADNLLTDGLILCNARGYEDADSHWIVDNFLAGEGAHLNISKGSPAYNSLFARLKQAVSENLSRTIDTLQGKVVKPRDFRDLGPDSIVPPLPGNQILLGSFLDNFMDYQRRRHAETTPSSYELPVRILREIVGEKMPLPQITRNHIEKACEILERVPVNMAKRYPELSIEDAIAAADRTGNKRLSPRTLSNYYTLIVAIFNYACEDRLITENPAKGRKLREIFAHKKAPTRRALFSADELNAIFHAPLYLGCKDDEKNYARPGTRHPRRGRFWVPLLGLLQGLRCNEACQLYAEDIKEEGGIPCIQVREDLDHTKKSDKRVKNRASWRTIPIHPEIVRIGFLEFVKARRASGPAERLFPELHAARNTARYSHLFSKWFGRYLVSACGHKPKATFHSFRHHFRTALMNAGVSKELAEALGGWKSETSCEYEYRHAQIAVLRKEISKVAYPELDLRHLS